MCYTQVEAPLVPLDYSEVQQLPQNEFGEPTTTTTSRLHPSQQQDYSLDLADETVSGRLSRLEDERVSACAFSTCFFKFYPNMDIL